MKSWKYILALVAIPIISQATIITNTSYNVIGSSAGNKYDDFWWDVASYSDVVFSWDFDQSLAGDTPRFRMSQMTSTGRVVYVNFTTANSDIAVSTTNITVTLPRTNMPYRGVYEAEVNTTDGTYWTPVSRGKVNVTLSLYDPALTNFALPSPSEDYVLKVGDFTQFTALGGTNGQVYTSDGSGGGSWTDQTGGGVMVLAGTNITVSTNGSQYTVSEDGSLQTAIDANSSTGALNTAAISANDTDISNLATTQQTVKATADGALQRTGGTMAGNINAGDNDITNIDDLEADRIDASVDIEAPTIDASIISLSPLYQVDTGGSGYLFQSDNNADVGTIDESARTVHSHTNFFKGHGGSSNITMKSNIFGVTNAISFTIGGDTYSILFD